MTFDFPVIEKKTLQLADRVIESSSISFVMGIVNANSDSFFQESRGGLERALSLVEEGADIIDIGSESTRPGASYLGEKEEIEKILPLVREIRKHTSIPISIDTRKSSVLKAALDEGADILNDVSALEDDENMAELVSSRKIPVILMHKRGIPSMMQKKTDYEDILKEVGSYLEKRADFALEKGIEKNKIILDPGIGFGKDLEGNSKLIAFSASLCGGKYPVLMALSRKSCIGQMTERDVENRLAGTLAADIFAVLRGAFMLRVHDVAETVDTLKVTEKLMKSLEEIKKQNKDFCL